MNPNHSHFTPIFVAIILTALITGIGLFFWQQTISKRESNTRQEVKTLQNDLTSCKNELSQTQECPTPEPAIWNTYNDAQANYHISFPTGNIIENIDGLRIDLEKTPDTLLGEKYMQLATQEIEGACKNNLVENITETQDITINDIVFTKVTGTGAAAGNIYDTTSYTTKQNNTCILVTFVLHSSNPGVYDNPPPAFNREQESAIFDQIINTFRFTN